MTSETKADAIVATHTTVEEGFKVCMFTQKEAPITLTPVTGNKPSHPSYKKTAVIVRDVKTSKLFMLHVIPEMAGGEITIEGICHYALKDVTDTITCKWITQLPPFGLFGESKSTFLNNLANLRNLAPTNDMHLALLDERADGVYFNEQHLENDYAFVSYITPLPI